MCLCVCLTWLIKEQTSINFKINTTTQIYTLLFGLFFFICKLLAFVPFRPLVYRLCVVWETERKRKYGYKSHTRRYHSNHTWSLSFVCQYNNKIFVVPNRFRITDSHAHDTNTRQCALSIVDLITFVFLNGLYNCSIIANALIILNSNGSLARLIFLSQLHCNTIAWDYVQLHFIFDSFSTDILLIVSVLMIIREKKRDRKTNFSPAFYYKCIGNNSLALILLETNFEKWRLGLGTDVNDWKFVEFLFFLNWPLCKT